VPQSTWAALGVIPYDWIGCAQFTDSYLWVNIGYLTNSIATRGHQMNSETGQNHWFASEYSTHLEPVTLDTMLVCMHLTARKCLYSWLIACLHLHHSKKLSNLQLPSPWHASLMLVFGKLQLDVHWSQLVYRFTIGLVFYFWYRLFSYLLVQIIENKFSFTWCLSIVTESLIYLSYLVNEIYFSQQPSEMNLVLNISNCGQKVSIK